MYYQHHVRQRQFPFLLVYSTDHVGMANVVFHSKKTLFRVTLIVRVVRHDRAVLAIGSGKRHKMQCKYECILVMPKRHVVRSSIVITSTGSANGDSGITTNGDCTKKCSRTIREFKV